MIFAAESLLNLLTHKLVRNEFLIFHHSLTTHIKSPTIGSLEKRACVAFLQNDIKLLHTRFTCPVNGSKSVLSFDRNR